MKSPLTPAFEEILAAESRVRKVLSPSPLTHSPIVSEMVGHDVYFKWDNKFKTGSFKERGAINVLSMLTPEQMKRGVCAASAGNHALALSYHAAQLKVPCTIVMPTTAPLVKVQSTAKTGATVILHGGNFDEAYEHALSLSAASGQRFVSAFDDELVIAGQGTAGLEIAHQLPDVDSVIVPVGGGGLISGIALALRQKKKDIFILGAQSQWAVEGRKGEHKQKGYLLPPVSIADGIAVKRVGKLTGPIVEACVDKLLPLSENQLAQAIIKFIQCERSVVEGAGAAGLAALLADGLPKKCKKTVVMVCGSNIDMSVLSRLIERHMGQNQRILKITVSVPDRPGSLHVTTGLLADFGANVLQVLHDRSFSDSPGNVDISFVLEVKDAEHTTQILTGLQKAGLSTKHLE